MSSEKTIRVVGDPQIRGGVYANAVIPTKGLRETQLDFILLDGAGGEGSDEEPWEGVLRSRVILPHEAVVELHRNLETYIEDNIETDDKHE